MIRLGPVVGAGLPDLFSLGGLLKITDYLGAGVNVGIIPSVRIAFYGDATVSYNEYDVYGRLFPFGGGFFVGAGVGYATVEGTLKRTFDTSSYVSQLPASLNIPAQVTYESRGSVETMVLTPQLGYFYTTRVGFSIGIDFGAQIPIAPSDISYDSSAPLPAGTPQAVVDQVRAQYIDPIDRDVEDTLYTVGRTPLPTVHLRIGWLI
ncbi:MAG: hypothetical protein JW940_02845 [Polyangiaceae bacterium]|nr:hypothetical protein [Polyangiaceae bacterium]